MGTLLLIRHAETDMAGTFCGQMDPPLNARGLAQVRELVERLRGRSIAQIYSSDLQRARCTAEGVAAAFGAPMRVRAGLREVGFGDWEGLRWEELERRDPEYARRWVEQFPRLCAPKGEDFGMFEERVLREFDAIAAAGEDAAIVTHAGVLRVVLTQRCGVTEDEAWARTKEYCGVFTCPSRGETVRVRELVGWGLDVSRYRPVVEVGGRELGDVVLADPVVAELPAGVGELMAAQAGRADLLAEMDGLVWGTGVVDLRKLIAFQRRLVFDSGFAQAEVPGQQDWAGLVGFAFGASVAVEYETVVSTGSELVVRSANPNLQVRRVGGALEVYGGSPFLEVAEYRGRWFLRDGYHRAYRLLRAGVACCPAVIVRAKTLAQLGPVQSWFFSEQVLFERRPPMVKDFLEDGLTMEYERERLWKTVRVRIEESMEPG